ncbi:MAG: FkbM family methyltransferase [Elusimicrobia bacterium]|nr:FkbM family methyltransferase [Elusimicrobiota bacterium]
MDADNLRKIEFLQLANKANQLQDLYYKKHGGPGPWKKLVRLYIWKLKYLHYMAAMLGISKRDVPITTFWGKRIFLPLSDRETTPLYFTGTLAREEQPLTKFLIKEFKKNDVFYDIGANFGFYTMLAEEFITDGEIHSFEPNPKTFFYLQRACAASKNNIFLNYCALTHQKDNVPFFIPGGDTRSGGSTTSQEVAEKYFTEINKTMVKSLALDDYVHSHRSPTILKLDIEGGECNFLKGAAQTLKKKQPVIVMEIWTGAKGIDYSLKAAQKLYEAGYKPYSINFDGELEKLEKIEPQYNTAHLEAINFVFKKA